MLRVTLILSYLLSLSVAWTTRVISPNVRYQFPRLSRFHTLGANKKNVVVPIQKSKSALERINGQPTPPSKTGLDKIMHDTNSALDILKENVGQLQVTENIAGSLTVQGDTEEEEGELERKSKREIRVPAPPLPAPTQIANKLNEHLLEEWRVLLHNDDINTFHHVETSLVKVVPHMVLQKAKLIANTVHEDGVGTVISIMKPLAEKISMALQSLGLTTTTAPDKNFES